MSRCQIVISVALLLAMGMTTRADETSDEADAALSEAITKLKAWRASFSTLRIRWKWSDDGQLIERMPELKNDPAKLAGWYHVEEWVWTDRQRGRYTTEVFEDGRSAKKETNFVSDGRFRAPMILHRVYEVHNWWLPETFDRYPPLTIGLKEIGGSRCVGCRAAKDSTETIWLDLEHDGLVRKVDFSGPPGWRSECFEFVQTASGHWFPKRGEYRLGWADDDTQYQFEVLEIATNETIPDWELETPSPPVRVQQRPAAIVKLEFQRWLGRVGLTVGIFIVMVIVSMFGLRKRNGDESQRS